jgi:hypothetical protein
MVVMNKKMKKFYPTNHVYTVIMKKKITLKNKIIIKKKFKNTF